MNTNNDDRLLTPIEVAEMLRVSVETLNVWRATKRYKIPYVKIGHSVRYRAGAIEKFIAERTIEIGAEQQF